MDVRAEVEKALDVAAKVAENPLAQSALGLVFVPPSVTGKVGELLQVLDAELAKTTPGPTSPASLPAASGGEPADAGSPANASGSADPKAEATPTGGPGSETTPSSPALPEWVKPLPTA